MKNQGEWMESNSKERILNAAIKVISQKGRYGTTMEEVAQEAKINKAMVYYYYSTKDNLYFEMLKSLVSRIMEHMTSGIREDISRKCDHVDIIANIIKRTSDIFQREPEFARIIIDAIGNAKDDGQRALEQVGTTPHALFGPLALSVIESGIKDNIFRNVDPRQAIISIIGMTLFHFLSRNIMTVFDIPAEDEERFLALRKDSIVDLIMNGMLKGKP